MNIAEYDKYMDMVEEVCSYCVLTSKITDEDEKYSKFCKDCPVMKSVDHYALGMIERRKKRGN